MSLAGLQDSNPVLGQEMVYLQKWTTDYLPDVQWFQWRGCSNIDEDIRTTLRNTCIHPILTAGR